MPPSPTPSPPLGTDQTDAEFKLSRKREREVSLEPVATPSSSQDIDASKRERKDSRTPAKKNRRRLDTTAEEDDSAGAGPRSRSNSISPPLSVSPRQEMRIRVRQISQGVGDLNWKNMQHKNDDVDEEMPDEKYLQSQPEEQDLQDLHSTQLEPAIEIDANGEKSMHVKVNVVTDHRNDAIVVDATLDESDFTPPKTPDASQMTQSIPESLQIQDDTLDFITTPAEDNSTDIGHLAVTSDSILRSNSESAIEKGLKRKFLERGTSQGPPEVALVSGNTGEEHAGVTQSGGAEEKLRETKTASPPPVSQPHTERTSPPSPKVPKLSGFMAYASTSSPFTTVKGNVFASSSKGSSGSSTPPTASVTKLGESSLSTSLPKRTGFEAFALSAPREPQFDNTPNQSPKRSGFEVFSTAASPFANAARAKSPALAGTTSPSRLGRTKSPTPRRNNSFTASPFGSYASGIAQSFAAHAPKRARADSPATLSGANVFGGAGNSTFASSVFGRGVGEFSGSGENEDSAVEDEDEEQPTTFGERLRAGRDLQDEEDEEDSKLALEEQDVITGEEDEETVIQVRGKLFVLVGANWKERGTGILKLNVKRKDGSCPRLVMRKEAVYTLLLNFTLFPGMHCSLAQDPRYVRFGVIENGKTTSYNLRVANAKVAVDLLEEVNANIPSA